jgi:transitional endoplasmic reticulum ATPase
VAQDFHLARFNEFRGAGMAAYRAGRWKDARWNLLKASEHLFKLAEEASGRLRDERKANAAKLLAFAKRIDPDAPPARPQGAGLAGSKGARASRAAAAAAESQEGEKRFQQVERPRVRFSDVAGLEDVKEQVKLKMIYPFRHREKAARYGIRPGGGVLLYGPPGTGKTLVARAIAGELEAAFYTVKPSEIMSKWVGESEGNIAALFRSARENPLSIVFIDEIEALVPKRRDSQSTVMQRVVPQILAELEGFESAGKNPILFLGATNEPWALDPAVLRPGRFDERIYIGLPDLPARRAMLDMYLRGRPLAPDMDLDGLAQRLDGYSGADIRNICDKAAAEAFVSSIESGAEGAEGPPLDAALFERVLAETRPSVKPGDLARFEKYAEVS